MNEKCPHCREGKLDEKKGQFDDNIWLICPFCGFFILKREWEWWGRETKK